ncbi:MAG: glycosyltransferase [Verrucomicrobiota bacterium]
MRPRILIATLFFPPTGGGGVQRPLKFAAHLASLGYETHVLAPDDPKCLERDESLAPPPGVHVVRSRNIGPRLRLLGAELYGKHGLARLAVHARSLPQRMLVPDPSVLWTLTAVPAALRLIERRSIDVVLTTSPPPSVHLVGAALKHLTGVRWVAELRDSIVFNPHRRFDVRGERSLARFVATYADAAVTASEGIAAELRDLDGRAAVSAIPSGCDFEDFEGLPHRGSGRLRITHTGNFLGRRDPRPFCEALTAFGDDVVARFVGSFRLRDRDYAEGMGLGRRIELVPFVSHRRALELQRDSEILLLLVPDVGGRGGHVLTGKVFEYLAARRPILAAVPPQGEAAALVERTGAGTVVAPDDVPELTTALRAYHARWRDGTLGDVVLKPELAAALSRRAAVERLAEVLEGVVRTAAA